MNETGEILIVEPKLQAASDLTLQLPKNFHVRVVFSLEDAEKAINSDHLVLLLDIDYIGENEGIRFLEHVWEKRPGLRCIFLVSNLMAENLIAPTRRSPLITCLSKPVDKLVLSHALSPTLEGIDFNPPGTFAKSDESADESSSHPLRLAATIAPVEILIVENDETTLKNIESIIPQGFHHHSVTNLHDATLILDSVPIDILICADNLPEESGLMFMARTLNKWTKLRRVLMGPRIESDILHSFLQKSPWFSYISKPVLESEFLQLLDSKHEETFCDEDGNEQINLDGLNSTRSYMIWIPIMALVALFLGALVFLVIFIVYKIKCHVAN